MKKYFLMLLAMCLFIGCGKDKEETAKYSTKELEGRWQRVDSRLPDGKLSSEFTGILAEMHKCNNQSFFLFEGNMLTFNMRLPVSYDNTHINCQGQTATVKYKIEGSSIKIMGDNKDEEIFLYDIIKLTETRMELRLNKDAADYFKRNMNLYNIQNYTEYSLEEVLLKNVMILKRVN